MAEECIDVRAIDAAVEIYIRTGFGLWPVVESAARVIAIPDAVEKLGFVTLNREDPFTKRHMQSGLGAPSWSFPLPNCVRVLVKWSNALLNAPDVPSRR